MKEIDEKQKKIELAHEEKIKDLKEKSNKEAEEYVKMLMGSGNKNEKRKIIIRAIMEEQVKFLDTCKQKWGDDFYSEIVADC